MRIQNCINIFFLFLVFSILVPAMGARPKLKSSKVPTSPTAEEVKKGLSPLANTSPGDHSVVYKPSGKEPPPIPSAKNKPIEVNWGELVKLDMKTGKETSRLKKLKGKRIKIPGYVVPLNDDFKTLEEFLFVPNAQACIHAPAPPPNLVIRSKVQKKIPLKKVHNPSWLFGTLEIITTQSFFGKSGYRISDAVLEKYEF